MNNSDLQNPELSIVIPLYNERDNLIPLEDKLEAELSKLNLSYEIILIDDGSVDGSAHLIESLQKTQSTHQAYPIRPQPWAIRGIRGWVQSGTGANYCYPRCRFAEQPCRHSSSSGKDAGL